MSFGNATLVYDGAAATVATVPNSRLQPFTFYQLRVHASNRHGTVVGPFSTPIRTAEAAPDGLPPLQLVAAANTSLTVGLLPPTRPNGAVSLYTVLVDGEARTVVTEVGAVVLGGLEPLTAYNLSYEAW